MRKGLIKPSKDMKKLKRAFKIKPNKEEKTKA